MDKSTNIIDKPRKAGGRDQLGTDKYMEALITFIKSANMPTTIAIQGEWGSGKTSMMNQIHHNLCESDENPENPFYGVWVNTWQYSLMKSQEETIVSLISGLTKEVVSIISSKHKSASEHKIKKVGSIIGKVAKSVAKGAISATGLDGGELVDSILEKEESETTIIDLRNSLQDLISECLELDEKAGKAKKGFLFFVDDLDRIDPPVAVQILELIKNIFEVENCLFILAIDYEVVIKGLEPKFGKLTEKNEREFRSFFDKIIQLPFSMPLGSYKIDDFLIESLLSIRYLNEEQAKDDDLKAHITEMARESVGTNPRSIKRLINTLSLIQIMNELEEGNFGEQIYEKLLNFGLVCLQIAYPSFYYLIVEEPEYINWNEKLANKLRLKPLSDQQLEVLNDTEEFDEDWEKVVYRSCANDAYLVGRAFNISNLLNVIRDVVPDKENFQGIIEKVLTLSSVTSVSMDAKPKNTRVRMTSWQGFAENLKKTGTNDKVINIIKTIHDYCQNTWSEDVVFVYTPNTLSIKSSNSKINKKRVCTIKPQKNAVKLKGIKGFGAGDKDPILKAEEDFNNDIKSYLKNGFECLAKGKDKL